MIEYNLSNNTVSCDFPSSYMVTLCSNILLAFLQEIMNIVTINENVYHEQVKFCQWRQNTKTINIIRLMKFIKPVYYILESREYVHCVVDISNYKMYGLPSIVFEDTKSTRSW